MAGAGGHTVYGVGLGHLVAGIAVSNPARGMVVFFVFICFVVLCQ
jgi:hypothetical protein